MMATRKADGWYDPRWFELTGKVALVAGGAGMLGRHIAGGLAAHGATVILADINDKQIEEAKHAISAYLASVGGFDRDSDAHSDGHVEAREPRPERSSATPSLASCRMDVTDPTGVDEAVAAIIDSHGRIDILVNSVGINNRKAAEDYTFEEWQRVLQVNLNGTFLPAQRVGREMIAQGSGKIVNIASVSSLLGHPHHAPYATSKGGVSQLTKVLGVEWIKHGVHVNAIGPAYTETELTRAHLEQPGVRERIVAGIPAGRLGTPSDIVGLAVFLCSRASDFVVGQTIYVDGGRTAD